MGLECVNLIPSKLSHRVVPLGFGVLLSDPEGLIRAIFRPYWRNLLGAMNHKHELRLRSADAQYGIQYLLQGCIPKACLPGFRVYGCGHVVWNLGRRA